ncbi:MAG: GH3 auxin-responsive promoter family protein [Planctomycetes bacterium]|nr:GH3 auxin-responsive promoter family protein [Planctomycetota bacterium]
MLERAAATIANGAWAARCLPAAAAFRRALRDPEAAQARLLARLLRANSGSDYGRRHGFAGIRSARDFQDAVPIAGYDDLEPWIARALGGEPRVLTEEPVLLFEKTSGSSAPAKYIPYTAALLREFRRAVRAWMADLFAHAPGAAAGQAYWTITPAGRAPERSSGGIPIGLASDRGYFDPLESFLLRRILAVPERAAAAASVDECLQATAEHLARCRSLALISVWNPSFLTLLCERLAEDPVRLWPRLRVISCWADAHARGALPALRALFPHAEIQGKGLLATEGVVSIPLAGAGAAGCALAVTSHFFEFLEPDGNDSGGGARPRLAHELETGKEYSVLLTTGGGLWRYRLGDRVRVTGFIRRTPLLEFLGRDDGVSDLCGEKLHAAFAGRVLAELCPAPFAMLAPSRNGRDRYTLYVEGAHVTSGALDAKLRANPHYDYARNLGQLAEPAIFRIRHGAQAAYLRRLASLGQRIGGVKPAPLHKLDGWESWFEEERPREEVGAGAAVPLRADSFARFRIDVAGGEDDGALRALLRRNPMGRRIRVAFEREPRYFDAARVQGGFHQTIVGRDLLRGGRIIGCGTRSVANAFVNGVAEPLGYLSDLRLDSAYRGGTLVARGYRFFRELHGDGRTRLYATVIFGDNRAALDTIAAGRAQRAGLPRYRDLGAIHAPGIRIGRRRPPLECNAVIDRAARADLPEILACLNRNNRRKQFAPVHRAEEFADGGRWLDFRIEDFHVARRGGEIAGVLGRWDQRRFKQTRIAGYGAALAALYPLFGLPRPGDCLRSAYASFAAVDGDDVALFRALLRALYNDCVEREDRYLIIALHERDSLRAALCDYSHRPFTARLYSVAFEDGEEARRKLDDRVPYIEAATL